MLWCLGVLLDVEQVEVERRPGQRVSPRLLRHLEAHRDLGGHAAGGVEDIGDGGVEVGEHSVSLSLLITLFPLSFLVLLIAPINKLILHLFLCLLFTEIFGKILHS